MSSDDRKTPARRPDGRAPAAGAARDGEVASFIEKVKALGEAKVGHTGERGRLIFAMDATMSRQPTWDIALAMQAEMFRTVEAIGGLDVQLVYFRGFGECRASRWVGRPEELARLMTTVGCRGGMTQIGKVLVHARRETDGRRVHALVYVGDCMEEPVDELADLAGQLGVRGLPVFLFQEGMDPAASTAFAEIARLTKGAHCRFDQGSGEQLRKLLTAVAVYAAGGRSALIEYARGTSGGGARLLLEQLE
ncbi:MAG: VWA domain-containing protein [Rhizobiales bacterium]|nr:VWA domain-containing protein [Hyphomicrobiales bacterium]